MNNLPIAYIDSGFGGLTVVKQSLKQLPNESIIYIGDNGRAPYGPRPTEEVREYIWQMTRFLLDKGIKMLVIACNTGTAAALDDLREHLEIPVLGVIHAGSRAAIQKSQNNKIGIIGTQGTIQSGMYTHLLREKDPHLDIYTQACPELVTLVEESRQDREDTPSIIEHNLHEIKKAGVDTLILGCTHYPILKDVIQAYMGPTVELIDSGVETVNDVSFLLDYFQLGRSSHDNDVSPAVHTFYTTGEGSTFDIFLNKWLNEGNYTAQELLIKGDTLYENNRSES